jgi:WD40 repeat protein
MQRFIFHLSYIGFLLLLGFTSCQAQTVPRCRQADPLPAKLRHNIAGLSFTRDGKTLVSAGGDTNIKFWNVATGEVQRTLSGHTNIVYKAVFSPNEKLIASSSRDHTVRLWDVATGRELHKFTEMRCSVKAVAFSPNGKMVTAVGNDGMLKIWDVESGKEIASLVHTDSKDVDISNYSVVFSRDGKKIYAGNGDGTISEWDTETGKETRNWKAHGDGVFGLIFSPDNRILASEGNDDFTTKLWDTKTWREIRTLANPKTEGLLQRIKSIAFSPDGKLIAVSETGFDTKLNKYAFNRTNVWNVTTGEKIFTVEGHKSDIDAVVFTPDGRFVVSGSTDGNIKFWDVKTGRETRTFTAPLIETTGN